MRGCLRVVRMMVVWCVVRSLVVHPLSSPFPWRRCCPCWGGVAGVCDRRSGLYATGDVNQSRRRGRASGSIEEDESRLRCGESTTGVSAVKRSKAGWWIGSSLPVVVIGARSGGDAMKMAVRCGRMHVRWTDGCTGWYECAWYGNPAQARHSQR
jgi:hypothetical protein